MFSYTAKNSVIPPNFMESDFRKAMQKVCLSTKFPHRELVEITMFFKCVTNALACKSVPDRSFLWSQEFCDTFCFLCLSTKPEIVILIYHLREVILNRYSGYSDILIVYM